MYLNPKVRTGQSKLYLGGTSLCPRTLVAQPRRGRRETSQVKEEQLYSVPGFLPKSWLGNGAFLSHPSQPRSLLVIASLSSSLM